MMEPRYPEEPLLQSDPMKVEPRLPTRSTYEASVPRYTTRRVKRTIRRVDPWSVLKFSLGFYLAVMVVSFIVAVILFYAASSAGIVKNIESFIQEVGWPKVQIRPAWVFRVVLLIGFVNVIVWSAVNLIVAFLYNLVADLVGGIEVTMSEREV